MFFLLSTVKTSVVGYSALNLTTVFAHMGDLNDMIRIKADKQDSAKGSRRNNGK